MKKIALWVLTAVVLTGCGSKSKQMGEASNDFAVETVQTTSADLKTSYPATIKGMQDIEIRPKVSGYLVKLLVDEDVLKDEYVGCHPCVNTSSLKLKTEDVFGKYLKAVNHTATTVVLKGE